jgi:hypothetical protein
MIHLAPTARNENHYDGNGASAGAVFHCSYNDHHSKWQDFWWPWTIGIIHDCEQGARFSIGKAEAAYHCTKKIGVVDLIKSRQIPRNMRISERSMIDLETVIEKRLKKSKTGC